VASNTLVSESGLFEVLSALTKGSRFVYWCLHSLSPKTALTVYYLFAMICLSSPKSIISGAGVKDPLNCLENVLC
jgi:hypothetical protein